MYEIEITEHFSSAHRLRGQGSRCEDLHGHNWFVTVTLGAAELDEIGIAIDFKVVKELLAEVVGRLDHQYLNEVPPFDVQNPSAENLARFIYEEMALLLRGKAARMQRVKVAEGPRTAASYIG
ncbi:MAG: 6-carboxytetrahydropterin synthase QueD [Deltaproteobacteria bacterium]|nr:6-carboxytetrahydropterin synthase QueD [Deltaproteobacteria bacterium]